MIKILELFGGIGAPRKALINLGIDHKSIDYVEIDEKAVRAYNALYDHLHKPQSVAGWNLCPDILVHGSPCQDFSRAGIRLGGKDEDKTRSSLMWETLRIIENLGNWKPKVVIWENVKGVLDKDMIHSFNKYLNRMRGLGYTNSFEVLNAMDFGIPQARERVFTISLLGNQHFDFSKLERKPMRDMSEFLESEVDGRYTLCDGSMKRNVQGSSTFVNPSGTKFKGRIEVIADHVKTISTKQDRSPNAGVVQIGVDTYRLLTERECWRLMGFDDEDFDKVRDKYPSREGFKNGILYKLAGNSIVVQVLEAIFEVVLNPSEVEESYLTERDGQLKLMV